MSKLSIILVNYRTWQDTIECIDSILCNDYQNFEIIIVEVSNQNNSFHELEKYSENIEKVKIIEFPENKGFAEANNIAIKYVLEQNKSDFLWILNNDTVIKKDSITELFKFYESKKDEKIGFIGSKLMYYDNPEIIQTVGGKINKWLAISKLIGKGEKDIGQFDNQDLKPDYVIGAAMFLHKKIISEIGLMPTGYFLYSEDIDWCVTAQKANFENFTATKSVVLHKQGKTIGNKYLEEDFNPITGKYLYSSYLKFFKKHYIIHVPMAYFMLIKKMFGRLARNKKTEAKIILNVIIGK